MNKQQSGFTLIELVVVIVILGILAATALPKFVDLKSDAGNASAQAVAGAHSSFTSQNYAKRLINSANGVAIASGALCSAALASTNLGATDALVTVQNGTSTISCAAGDVDTSCKVKHSDGNTSYAVTVVCTG